MRKYFVCIVLFILIGNISAQSVDSTRKSNPLIDDAYLHPIDCITPYTLQKGEWIYGQSLQTLPFPSWAFYGITDRLTTQIDLLPWIGGLVTELHKPIPSFNLRYRFNEQEGIIPTIGVEAMFVHMWDTLLRFETPKITVWESGSYFHVKPVISYRIRNDWYVHVSGGIDFMHALTMQNNADSLVPNAHFTDTWNPNYCIGVDYRPSDFISYHVAYSYGGTLTFLENVPRKIQINYGFRVAPFYRNEYGILRNMRIEFTSINGYFPDINTWQGVPVPIYPYIYWQWKRDKQEQR